MIDLFAVCAAAWLTGMIPLAAVDACDGIDWSSYGERFAAYWLWPFMWPVLVVCRFVESE